MVFQETTVLHKLSSHKTLGNDCELIPFSSPFIMSTKKRKVDAECRVYNEEWGVKYFFVETKDQKTTCVIYSESVAVLKEYNLRRHYETKHLSTYSKFSGKLRSEKYESMKRGLETQRNLFTRKFAENESVTRTRYKIVHKMAERGKPFTDGNFIKECMMEAANDLCPEKADLFGSISLSASSVVRRTEELGENIVLQIREKAKNLLWYSLVLDESTDLSSTSQLLVFIRGVNLDFQITEELASVCSMHGTTTGKDIFMEVKKTLQDYNLQWNQLRGVAVDGGKNMAGVRKGLVGQIRTQLEDLQIPGSLCIHYIIHQQALCGKDLDISCVLKPVVSAVNFIRGHALNHRQFQAFLEEIDSDFCDLPYHTAVRIIKGFRRKLSLFEAQLEGENFSHFHCFKEVCATIAEDVNLDFPKNIIRDLKKHFLKRFSDLDRIESDILQFQNPFDCNLDDVPVELQLELIDLQANDLLKEKHREEKLVEFYRCLPDVEFPKLKKFAAGMASLFGTTYVCEQTFSKMKLQQWNFLAEKVRLCKFSDRQKDFAPFFIIEAGLVALNDIDGLMAALSIIHNPKE
ncbi:general transcription factor II-I repeat domain-containing protein 2-like [Homarus americanus]|uniref:general transcription factor II-I repeat domain-containing protein 2-like n=1 Tax=Homarus americanus TaxID=6706 RepID=UPI001C450FC0|nr:general transcription factor II-I repeat domain-containing protein 2-like [Homarus americanus]